MCRWTVVSQVCANCLQAARDNEGDGVRPSHLFPGSKCLISFLQGAQVLGKASEARIHRPSSLTIKTQKATAPKPADDWAPCLPTTRQGMYNMQTNVLRSTRRVLYYHCTSPGHHASRRRTWFDVTQCPELQRDPRMNVRLDLLTAGLRLYLLANIAATTHLSPRGPSSENDRARLATFWAAHCLVCKTIAILTMGKDRVGRQSRSILKASQQMMSAEH
ncbi:hypothetical protein B0I37DRAFT_186420 [Chaetomium sp. MPI-CAGE-AT-0009]|nr:hypothetical protein B0I37DRAFT_186420 [Chaetomium sp. MPI-CAGE-AT-0009]